MPNLESFEPSFTEAVFISTISTPQIWHGMIHPFPNSKQQHVWFSCKAGEINFCIWSSHSKGVFGCFISAIYFPKQKLSKGSWVGVSKYIYICMLNPQPARIGSTTNQQTCRFVWKNEVAPWAPGQCSSPPFARRSSWLLLFFRGQMWRVKALTWCFFGVLVALYKNETGALCLRL